MLCLVLEQLINTQHVSLLFVCSFVHWGGHQAQGGDGSTQEATVCQGRARHAAFAQSGLWERRSPGARGHSPSSASQVCFMEPPETICVARRVQRGSANRRAPGARERSVPLFVVPLSSLAPSDLPAWNSKPAQAASPLSPPGRAVRLY